MNLLEIKKELWGLSKSGVFRLDKIQEWVISYVDLYKKNYAFVYNQHLYTAQDGSTIRLPLCAPPKDEEIFLSLYESLKRILELHANETYFEHELFDYYKMINSTSAVNKWIEKNENFGAIEYVTFLTDYLDYNFNGKEEHLKVPLSNFKEFEIFVDRQDFKNTINFLEIFNEYYWVKEWHALPLY
jgi:hypothetical protein